ncbi:unnamed protein product [Parascedosporium putredinis]|uniref:Signal peptidase complex subunit 2 n=1 Tax=Parascedosporium putredinis TaxID=1442378 RepID=A0A9P1H1I9_9PEZI|nr:unnamed protein product [Parascedosporium putredinis]CAI7992817.1 unnamed protein product [Parascedosporium putredinis]
MAAERISVYNLADLKNTTDDAIPNYLNSLKIKQVHTLADVRLALGYSAFFIAAACFGWDYKFGFESTKYLTAAAVAVYSILNGAMTFWMWYVEKGVVYEGVAPSGDKIRIASSTKPYDPTYNLTITLTPKSPKSPPQTLTVSRPFSQWFDEQGRFVTVPFQRMIATSVPLVAVLDPKRASKEDPAPSPATSPPSPSRTPPRGPQRPPSCFCCWNLFRC